MNIKIICVGKLKEKYLKDAEEEYLKRLSKYAKVDVIELPDEKFKENPSESEIYQTKQKEGEKIIKEINKLSKPYIISLDLRGKQYTSEELAEEFQKITTYSSSTVCLIIGGSLGIYDEVIKISNKLISFSKLTFPHQLIRIFLLEQIFRVFKINNNEKYHH